MAAEPNETDVNKLRNLLGDTEHFARYLRTVLLSNGLTPTDHLEAKPQEVQTVDVDAEIFTAGQNSPAHE